VAIPLLDREAVRVFSVVGLATLALVAVVATTPFGWGTVIAAGLVTLSVLILNRRALRIEALFPEIRVVIALIERFIPRRTG